MKFWSFIRRLIFLFLLAIIIIIVFSLIPVSFSNGDLSSLEQDEEISASIFTSEEESISNTYWNSMVEMQVTSIDEMLSDFNLLVSDASATVISSSILSVDTSSKTRTASFTLEMESTNVDAFLSGLRECWQVDSVQTYTNNDVVVTEDIDSWVKNLTLQESRYQTLLEEASTVSEIVKLEEELTRVRVELDKWQALKSKSELSMNQATVRVALKEGTVGELAWSVSIQNELLAQLERIKVSSRWLLVKLIGLLPYFLIGLVLFGIGRMLFRRGKR